MMKYLLDQYLKKCLYHHHYMKELKYSNDLLFFHLLVSFPKNLKFHLNLIVFLQMILDFEFHKLYMFHLSNMLMHHMLCHFLLCKNFQFETIILLLFLLLFLLLDLLFLLMIYYWYYKILYLSLIQKRFLLLFT